MNPFLELLAGHDDALDLDRAALELARIEYPDLAVEPSLDILDSHAAELADRLKGKTSGAAYVEAANQYLFGELGFTGNAQNYYDPRNSCLNDVLTARTGIPITLAIVYLEIARRLGRPVFGIGLPGHFLVQYRDADFSAFIDVFHGGRRLTAAECFVVAGESSGTPMQADPRWLAPVGKRQIVARMLNNLRGVYLHRRAYAKEIQAQNLLIAAQPEAADEYKQRGLVYMQMRNFAAARADLETYQRMAPEAADHADIEGQLRAMRRYQAGLN